MATDKTHFCHRDSNEFTQGRNATEYVEIRLGRNL